MYQVGYTSWSCFSLAENLFVLPYIHIDVQQNSSDMHKHIYQFDQYKLHYFGMDY